VVRENQENRAKQENIKEIENRAKQHEEDVLEDTVKIYNNKKLV
jgi:hypothetical protein